MSGNVLEWCNDWYSDTYYGDSSMTNPLGPYTGVDHVRRGGCWYSFFYYCRSAYRDHYAPTFAYRSIGFRLAITTYDSEGEGEPPVEGEGEVPDEGEGETPAEGEGETPAEGEGETPAEGEGETPAEGEGEPKKRSSPLFRGIFGLESVKNIVLMTAA